jgi:hypothetical protein
MEKKEGLRRLWSNLQKKVFAFFLFLLNSVPEPQQTLLLKWIYLSTDLSANSLKFCL